MAFGDGPLVAADEWFTHQIVETHAHVGHADRAWTEKVVAMAAARDGSLCLAFGLGTYVNRNVVDGWAAVSRGREQWTVRASRRLADDPTGLRVGPIRLEIEKPLQRLRFSCDANDQMPFAFAWEFDAAGPAVLEARDRSRARGGFRLESDLLRYHQVGLATGVIELEGRRIEIGRDGWFATRDHSWGVRHGVGSEPDDVEPRPGLEVPGVAFRFSWSPMLLWRPDGSCYGLHHQIRESRAAGFAEHRAEGTAEEAGGAVERFADAHADLRYDPDNRRPLGGTLHFHCADGSDRPVTLESVGETGTHLGLGLYFGLDGREHGQWRGRRHVEGEYVADCADPANARRIHQIRNTIVRVEDPVGGGSGWGDLQTTIVGAWPELGLTDESSFL